MSSAELLAAGSTVGGWIMPILLTYLVHSTLLLGLAWCFTRWPGLSHTSREVVWKAALVGGLVTVPLQAEWRVVGTPIALESGQPGAGPPVAWRRSPAPEPAATQPAPTVSLLRSTEPPARSADLPVSLAALGLIGWLLVATVLVGRYVVVRRRLRRLLATARPVTDLALLARLDALRRQAGIRRPVRLVTVEGLASPVAIDWNRICLPPAALTELDPEQQGSMLAHELGHLARFDPLWLEFGCLLERLLFVQPLNRLARRELQGTAEYLADDWAVRRTGSGLALARSLAKVAEWMDATPRPVPISGMTEERSHLVSRVRRLVEEHAMKTRPNRRWVLGAAMVLLAVTAVAAPGFTAATQGEAGLVPDQDRAVDPVIAALMQDTTSAVVIRALMDALRDPDVEVRRAAARSLAHREDPRAIPALVGALDDADAEVKEAAAEGLSEFDDPAARRGLIRLLDDPSAEVRKAALQALAHHDGAIPLQALERAARDADEELRSFAASQLGESDHPGAIALLRTLAADPSGEVRSHALQGLVERRDPGSADLFIAAARDADPDLRQTAIHALGELRISPAPAVVLEALRDPDGDVRQAAAWVLAELRDTRAVPALRTLLNDQDADVREAAVEALAEIGDPAAVDALVAALKSSDAKVRKRAAEALGR